MDTNYIKLRYQIVRKIPSFIGLSTTDTFEQTQYQQREVKDLKIKVPACKALSPVLVNDC